MLPRLLIRLAFVFAVSVPAHAQDAPSANGAGNLDAAWSVEVLRGSEVWRDFGRNGRAGVELRIGRPGIRVHDPATPPADGLRVHSATREPAGAVIPTHGVADAFDASRLPVQRLHRRLGDTRIVTHGLAEAFEPSRIRVHGFGGRRTRGA